MVLAGIQGRRVDPHFCVSKSVVNINSGPIVLAGIKGRRIHRMKRSSSVDGFDVPSSFEASTTRQETESKDRSPQPPGMGQELFAVHMQRSQALYAENKNFKSVSIHQDNQAHAKTAKEMQKSKRILEVLGLWDDAKQYLETGILDMLECT